jgi:D-threo-aldose 1-dehydrogenase
VSLTSSRPKPAIAAANWTKWAKPTSMAFGRLGGLLCLLKGRCILNGCPSWGGADPLGSAPLASLVTSPPGRSGFTLHDPSPCGYNPIGMSLRPELGLSLRAAHPLNDRKVMSLPTAALGEEIRTTRLGFGCASLFRISDRVQRMSLLGAAYDEGIRHFDVAPMYGLGRAEAELGSFARSRRSELTIATKFGIKPTLVGRSIGHVQGPIRRLFAAKPAVRDHARAPAGATRVVYEPSRLLYDLEAYNAAGARRSLERSLRALNTDYVDLLLLHEPVPGRVRSDEVLSCLEDARAAGLIRSWGIAGEPGPTGEVASSFPEPIPIRQLRDDIFLRSLRSSPDGAVFITYGVIAQALARLLQIMSTNDALSSTWQSIIGTNSRGSEPALASLLLRAAFRANRSGVVLFSTSKLARVRSAVSDLQSFHLSEDPDLDAFLQLLDTGLGEVQDSERKGS